ncbi:PAS/PAC sensor hybrid histidine kinase [Dehalogenimonas lykanthroporepellens BL-DC-9]|nr:PAS/PAC sensor hybrid histidine kinase [Dehalogenimonas lykanthroporepellens BL-DC-9]
MDNAPSNDEQNPQLPPEDLPAKEFHYRRLFETAPDGILVIDTETGNIIDVNPVLTDKFGYPRQEIINKPIWELGFLKKVFSDRNKLDELAQTDYMFIEDLSLETFTGKELKVDLVGNSYEVEHQKLIQLRLQLNRERTEAELRLDESRQRLNNLIEMAPIGIALSQQGNTIYANTRYLKMFGYENLEELVGTSFLNQIAPQSRVEAVEFVTRQEQGVKADTDHEFQGIRKDGSQFPFQTSVDRVELENGDALIGYFIDVTKRKQVELENHVLRDKAEMSSRLAAVGEMAAGIAHEINNPLTGVIGFSELLLERKDLPDDMKEELTIINAGSQRVKEIVKRMLTFARQHELVQSSASIAELLDNTLEMRAYVLRTSNIEVVREYDPDLPWMTADAGQLQQVFLNIIVNAEYAMKKVHGRGRLTVGTERVDERVRVTIEDDGGGIPTDARSRLFQPFFTTKEPGEGTGLGLSLSRGIVAEHGGTIDENGLPGVGARFIIDLPIITATGQAEDNEDSQASAPVAIPNGYRILAVDDEPAVRAYIKARLDSVGHRTEVTGDHQAAMQLLSEKEYDLVLLDIRMPGRSGLELYSEIIAHWPQLNRRVIFVTGDVSDQTVRDYLEQHHLPWVTKPFDLATLTEKIRTVMEDTGG